MIHAVHSANQHLYARELDEMFRGREAAAREGALVIDERDNASAVYLIRLESAGRLAESVRLNPLPVGNADAASGADAAWEATLWPSNPSDELVAGVREFCAA